MSKNKEYRYNAKIVSVYDGDTLTVDIDLGFDIVMKNQKIRIVNINTPEIRTRNLLEKAAGEFVQYYVSVMLPKNKEVILISKDFKGKFGRILGDIEIKDGLLSEPLIAEKMAVKYQGDKKLPFSDSFLSEIISLP
jgi:micrococcal nuclease